MTRKDYVKIAQVLNGVAQTYETFAVQQAIREIAGSLCEKFHEDNSNFNNTKFMEAVFHETVSE